MSVVATGAFSASGFPPIDHMTTPTALREAVRGLLAGERARIVTTMSRRSARVR